MMLTSVEKGEWIAHFNAKNSFPSKEVPCTSCNEGITMFGTNLKNRIERYESVEDFLDSFVCRTCKGKIKRGEQIEAREVEETQEESATEIDTTVYDDSVEEQSYVVEPGDDGDEVTEVVAEETTTETTEETSTEVFDDSEEYSDEGDESDHQSINTEALREKYKAFYAMKGN